MPNFDKPEDPKDPTDFLVCRRREPGEQLRPPLLPGECVRCGSAVVVSGGVAQQAPQNAARLCVICWAVDQDDEDVGNWQFPEAAMQEARRVLGKRYDRLDASARLRALREAIRGAASR